MMRRVRGIAERRNVVTEENEVDGGLSEKGTWDKEGWNNSCSMENTLFAADM